ncbi:hypothetical protein M1146_04575 [Patescibacteria group bacterium]|nr:hypothetical protein [Patescibacteria group bacterium]
MKYFKLISFQFALLVVLNAILLVLAQVAFKDTFSIPLLALVLVRLEKFLGKKQRQTRLLIFF